MDNIREKRTETWAVECEVGGKWVELCQKTTEEEANEVAEFMLEIGLEFDHATFTFMIPYRSRGDVRVVKV